MDAKQLGLFIAERRKELGLTQALLAEKLHVTDKAVSRWERGIGLPDVNSIEPLAAALEVSLVELMQAKRNEQENISKKDAEQILADTLRLSKTTDKIVRSIGGMILSGFGIISILLLLLQISDAGIVWHPIGSIITGLIAWGIPVWKISFARGERRGIAVILSLGFAFISIVIQFLSIAHEVHTGDWSAIEDTVDALIQVVVLFGAVTLVLNVIMVRVSGNKQ